jgi:hypothetical protein
MLVDNIVFKDNGTTRMTTTSSYDSGNRVTQISSTPTAGDVLIYGWQYNSAGQRWRAVNQFGTVSRNWQYSYDSLG